MTIPVRARTALTDHAAGIEGSGKGWDDAIYRKRHLLRMPPTRGGATGLPLQDSNHDNISDQIALAQLIASRPSPSLGSTDSPPAPGTVSMVFCAAS